MGAGVITAEAHSEPTRQASQRRPVDPRRQLARYLMRNAGPLPSAPPQSVPSQALHRTAATAEGLAPVDRRALEKMQRIWGLTRGYFPGREMPVPRFGARETSGSVGWATDPQGKQRPVGINWDRYSSRALVSKEQFDRDSSLLTLLHEWAHNLQRPELHTGPQRRMPSGDMVHPAAEGGAEAFAVALAPKIAKLLGQPYDRRDARRAMALNPYRPYALNAVRKRGMDWVMRGQFQ